MNGFVILKKNERAVMNNLNLFAESSELEIEIKKQLAGLKYV